MPFRINFFPKIILATLIIALSMSFCFNFALAQPDDPTTKVSSGCPPGQLCNPLGTNDANELVGRVIKNILGIVGSLALLMFVVGGLMWMLSAGNEQRVKKGKDILTWASLGLVIIFTSYAILKFVFQVLTDK